MIWILIGLIGFPICLAVFLFLYKGCYDGFTIKLSKFEIPVYLNDEGAVEVVGSTFMFLSMGLGLVLFADILIYICMHTCVDKSIRERQIEYQSLVKRYEIVNSEYEDVSKSEVIKDVAKWNQYVYSAKYWSENPWTSWFWDQEYVDSLEYIDLEE